MTTPLVAATAGKRARSVAVRIGCVEVVWRLCTSKRAALRFGTFAGPPASRATRRESRSLPKMETVL